MLIVNGIPVQPRDLGHRLADDVHDNGRRGHDRRMIDGMGPHLSLHPLGHEALIFLDDHAVLLGHQVPGRTVLPQRPIDGDADAGRRDRPLNRRQHGQFLRGSILGEGGGESGLGQIDQAVIVGSQLGRLRVRRRCGRRHPRRFRPRPEPGRPRRRAPCTFSSARCRDDGAGIGVADENDRPRHALERSVERRHIILERCQRQRRRDHLDARRPRAAR